MGALMDLTVNTSKTVQDILYIQLHVAVFLTYMELRNVGLSQHYFPADHASSRLSPKHYNHHKLVLLKKSLDLPSSRTMESLCLPNTTSLGLANCSSATGMPHAVELRRKGWREAGLVGCVFGFAA